MYRLFENSLYLFATDQCYLSASFSKRTLGQNVKGKHSFCKMCDNFSMIFGPDALVIFVSHKSKAMRFLQLSSKIFKFSSLTSRQVARHSFSNLDGKFSNKIESDFLDNLVLSIFNSVNSTHVVTICSIVLGTRPRIDIIIYGKIVTFA